MAKKNSKQDPVDQPSFEEALQRLEEIVHLLEEGEIGLSEALERYEEGVKLLRQSYELLQRAERRIELLGGVDADGNPITRPFDDRATMSAEITRPTVGMDSDPEEDSPEGFPRKPPTRNTDMDAPGGLF